MRVHSQRGIYTYRSRRRRVALAAFQSRRFDLVLLDIMLPKSDGFGVCEVIRRQSRVPILMLTALDGEENQLRGFKLNIDDYITKPFSMAVLLEKIRVILNRSSENHTGKPFVLSETDNRP